MQKCTACFVIIILFYFILLWDGWYLFFFLIFSARHVNNYALNADKPKRSHKKAQNRKKIVKGTFTLKSCKIISEFVVATASICQHFYSKRTLKCKCTINLLRFHLIIMFLLSTSFIIFHTVDYAKWKNTKNNR